MKRILGLFTGLLGCLSIVFAQDFSQSSGFESLDYLYSISGKSTLAGQQGRQYWEKMRRIAGDYPALWGEDLSFSPFDGTSSMAQWRTLVTHDAKQRWEKGAFVSMMFHACPPTQAEPCNWDGGVLSKLSDAQWTELITDGTQLNKNWKARLDTVYPYLKELDDAGVELLFRPFHEMNQGAFWWGGRPGANGTVKLYQLTRDYLEKIKGLTNLIWVWDMQDFSTLSKDLDNYDPGNDYWDILALDVYWSDGQGYTTNKYNLVKKKAAGKPIAIGECDVLPSSNLLKSQPDWTFFMAWSELTQQKNSDETIKAVYNAPNVLTLNQVKRGMTGMDNVNVQRNGLSVFPNPAKDYVQIEGISTIRSIRLYDLSGRLVKNFTPCNLLNISNINSGIYILQITANGCPERMKLIID